MARAIQHASRSTHESPCDLNMLSNELLAPTSLCHSDANLSYRMLLVVSAWCATSGANRTPHLLCDCDNRTTGSVANHSRASPRDMHVALAHATRHAVHFADNASLVCMMHPPSFPLADCLTLSHACASTCRHARTRTPRHMRASAHRHARAHTRARLRTAQRLHASPLRASARSACRARSRGRSAP
jgi:hypothetical protein